MDEAHEEAVVVGSVGHVIRRAFQDLFGGPPPQPTPAAPAASRRSSAASAATEGKEQHEKLQAATDEPAQAAAPSRRASIVPDPRAAARLAEIDDRLQESVSRTRQLEQYLWDVSAAAAELDVKQAADLREKGLILGTEVPLAPSRLRIDRDHLTNASLFGDMGQGLVTARDIMAVHERRAAIASGNAGQVGQKAPDFVASSDDPGYLKMTAAQTLRAETIKARAMQTGTLRMHADTKKVSGRVTMTAADEAADKEMVSMLRGGGEEEYEMSGDDELIVTSPVKQSPPKAKPPKKKEAHVMHKDDIDANKALGDRMSQKLNYLRNPRHVPPPRASKLDPAASKTAVVSTTATLPVVAVGEGQVGTVAPGDTGAAVTRAGIAPAVHGGVDALAGPFAVTPARVMFNKYAVDVECSMVVTLVNQDNVSRSVRVLPPVSPFFSIDPVVYPGKQRAEGMIAPGMSVKVTVRFCPNTLGTFEDCLTLMTELGSFKVPLNASLPAPALTLPLDLNAGYCLRGDELTTTVLFENQGAGSGKYRLFTAEEWPSVTANSSPAAVARSGPFAVSPTYFSIDPGMQLELSIVFSPPDVGPCEAEFVMVCDNCEVTRYTVRGVSGDLDVTIARVQGRPLPPPSILLADAAAPAAVPSPTETLSLVIAGRVVNGVYRAAEELDPAHAPVRLNFDPLDPGVSATKTVTVFNPTAIPLRFEWHAEPWWTPSGVPSTSPPTETAVTISPDMGMLESGVETTFTVRFAPDAPIAYQRGLKLMIMDVPLAGERRRKFEARQKRSGVVQVESGSSTTDAPGMTSPGGKALSVSSSATLRRTADGGTVAGSAAIPREAVEVAAVFVQGGGAPVTVFASPAVVVVPGPQLPGQTGVQSFRLTNTSSCATWFTFSEPVFVNGPLSAFPDVGDGDDTPRDSRLPALSLSPDCGSIPAGGSVLINASFTALSAEACVRGQYAINVTAGLYYSGRPQPEEAPAHTVSVRVCASTRLGEVMIVEPEVDLGLSAIDKTVKRTVHVRNITNAAVRWNMSQPAWEAVHPAGSTAAAAGRGVAITFEPSSGLLGPNESVVVALSCLAASKPIRIRDVICCSVPGGGSVYSRVRGEVQVVAAYLNTQFLNLGVSFMAVNVTRIVTLTNLSNFPALFSFDNLLDLVLDPTPLYSLSASPSRGSVPPKGSKEIAITFTPLRQGSVDALFAIDVEGLPQPLGVSIRSEIKGLVTGFSSLEPRALEVLPALPESTPEQREAVAYKFAKDCAAKISATFPLNFGTDIPLMTQRTLRLTVHNLSGISSDVYVAVRRYRAPDAPSVEDATEKCVASSSKYGRRRSSNPLESLRTAVKVFGVGAVSAPKEAEPAAAGVSTQSSLASLPSAKDVPGSTTKPLSKVASDASKPSKAATQKSSTMKSGAGSMSTGPLKLLSTTVEQQKFSAEAGKEVLRARETESFLKEKLSGHNGMTFWSDSYLRRMLPWNTVSFDISAVGDMPGLFEDELVLLFDGEGGGNVKSVTFPLSAALTGSPLQFDDTVVGMQLTGAQPVLSFGELPVRSTAQTKVVRIKNSGAQDAVLRYALNFHRAASAAHVDVVGGDPAARLPPLSFTASPTVLCVPARGMAEVSVTADPAEWTADAEAAVTASGFASAGGWRQASMAASVQWVPKGDGDSAAAAPAASSALSETQFGLMLRMKPVVPCLAVDKRVSDGAQWIKFCVWANKPASHESYSRRITMTNTLSVPLTFTVATNGPYAISACNTNAPKHPLSEVAAVATMRSTALAPSRVFTLLARTNLVVDVAFDPTHADARPLEASLFGSTLTSGGGPAAARADDAAAKAASGGLREEFVGALVVTFANGSVQEVALRTDKLRPVVVAAPPLVPFGIVHVESKAASTLYLANPTVVEAEWDVRHVPIPARKAPVSFDAKSLGLVGSQARGLRLDATPREEDNLIDDPSVFEFGLKGGVLQGPTTAIDVAHVHGLRASHGLPPPCAIPVTFTPKQNVRYRCRFRVSVRSGEGFDVVVTGQGTYDEHAHKK